MQINTSPMLSWTPLLRIDGDPQWRTSPLRFHTQRESDQNALHPANRQFLVVDSRSVQCTEPPTHRWCVVRGLLPFQPVDFEGADVMQPANMVTLVEAVARYEANVRTWMGHTVGSTDLQPAEVEIVKRSWLNGVRTDLCAVAIRTARAPADHTGLKE